MSILKNIYQISNTAKIHPTVSIGSDGMSFSVDSDGNITEGDHYYGIIIHNNVRIDPYTVVHKGSWRNTEIKENTKIGSLVNIGHNVIVGKNCVITTHTCIGGSVVIHENVWIGMGVMIKPRVTIFSGIVIGQGSNVLNTLKVPGVYIGNPAKWIKERDKEKAF
jgi:UDP-3-O-[3-hydroxymyristoyl] glucosamine N-acyltransferase